MLLLPQAGRFAQCETYKKVGCTAGFAPAGGGFAEYIRVMDWIVSQCRMLIKVPDDMPFEQASFIEPVNTCYKAVAMLSLKPDETVLVIGQGPIGILLAALATADGSDRADQRSICRSGTLIAAKIWAGSSAGRARRCSGRGEGRDGGAWRGRGAGGGGRGCADRRGDGGDPAGWARDAVCVDAARRGALRSCGGVHGREDADGVVLGSSGAIQRRGGAACVLKGYRDGNFDLTRLISHRFSLEDAVAAIDLASHPQAGLDEDRDQP